MVKTQFLHDCKTIFHHLVFKSFSILILSFSWLCPLLLLVGAPSAIRPELAFRRAEHSRPNSDVAKYIFDI